MNLSIKTHHFLRLSHFRIISVATLIIFGIVLSGCGGGGGANQITGQNVNIPMLIGSELKEETYGTSSERLLGYLREFANCGDCLGWSGTAEIHTFYEINNANDLVRINPTLRIASNANDEQKAIVHHAASLINNVLPYDRHIKLVKMLGACRCGTISETGKYMSILHLTKIG